MLEDLHEPLARGDELERPVALLVELDGVLERLRLRDQRRRAVPRRGRGGVAQQLDDRLLRLLDPRPGEPRVGLVGEAGVEARKRLRPELQRYQRPVPADHLPQRERLLAPPLHVGRVAERAHHQDPGALLAIHELAREDRHGHAEERRDRSLAEEAAVALVVRVRRHTHARGQQLGPCRRDHEPGAALDPEAKLVEGAPHGTVFDFRLRDSGAEVHVPQRWGFDLVDVALAEEVEEAPLREAPAEGADRGVLERPVDGQPQPLPQGLEGLLVLGREHQAQLDEVLARDTAGRLLARGVVGHRQHQPGLEGDVGLAAHVVVVLDPALGRQPVVVPAHRVEHVLAAHALVAREHVRLRVAEHVADVERSRHRGRRGVDHERRAGIAVLEAVDAPLAPEPVPLLLGWRRLEVRAEGGRVDGDDHGRVRVRRFRSSEARP